MAHLLELKDFHYYYGNIHVVKGINLYVDEGEIVTLIGANGAGKTTTMQTIAGLTPAAGVRGEILFEGAPIQKKRGFEITALGLASALEGRHIFSQLSVEDNLMMGAFKRKDRSEVNADIRRMYQMFPRLEERKNQSGGTLSGGEQQMLAIARALVSRPKLLLLDEPSLGIAPIITREIFKTIKQIANDGTTILVVEQNSSIALSTADRGYVMQTGEIIISGLCSDLQSNEDVKKAYLGSE